MKRNYISPELLYTQIFAEDILTGSAGSEYVPTTPSILEKNNDGSADFFYFPTT